MAREELAGDVAPRRAVRPHRQSRRAIARCPSAAYRPRRSARRDPRRARVRRSQRRSAGDIGIGASSSWSSTPSENTSSAVAGAFAVAAARGSRIERDARRGGAAPRRSPASANDARDAEVQQLRGAFVVTMMLFGLMSACTTRSRMRELHGRAHLQKAAAAVPQSGSFSSDGVLGDGAPGRPAPSRSRNGRPA